MKRKALGKTISQLLPEGKGIVGEAIRWMPVEQLTSNPFQPRKAIDEEGLETLAKSLESQGMLQPIVVAQTKKGYQVVAGERRLQAAKRLGWSTVPVLVKEVRSEEALLLLALIENIQREDLNPIEEAEAMRQLQEQFGFTQEALAEKTGKSRSAVANQLRLLRLPDEVKELVRQGKLSEGHARVLLREKTESFMIRKARKMVAEGWTVRQAENKTKEKRTSFPDPFVRHAEEQLSQALQAKVRIASSHIKIFYHGSEDLERLYALLGGKNE